MSADTRIETNAVNDLLGIQPLHLGISIKFIEVADTQSQIGVGMKTKKKKLLLVYIV